MRDVGFLVWVGLLIVGVIGSMVSSLRRQAQARQAAPRPRPGPPLPAPAGRIVLPLPVAPPQPAPAVARVPPIPGPSARPRVASSPASAGWPSDPFGRSPMAARHPVSRFLSPTNVAGAVVAAEVLGKPIALRDE